MNNREVWDLYAERSATVSRNARALGFAAVAACWVFKTPDNRLPMLLALGLLATVTFFLLDTAQYVQPTCFLRRWAREREIEIRSRTGNPDGESYELPGEHDKWPYRFWWGKLLAVGIAWLLIAGHVIVTVF